MQHLGKKGDGWGLAPVRAVTMDAARVSFEQPADEFGYHFLRVLVGAVHVVASRDDHLSEQRRRK